MVHARVSDEYIHSTLMYMTDHISPVITIKHLLKQDSEPNTPQKLATGMKPSVSNPRALFCPCVVWKATASVDTKALNMRNRSQNIFNGIFVGIPQHQKGYLIYVPITHKIVSSHDVVFYETSYSALAYTPRPYSEALAMWPVVSYIPYATSSHAKTGNIITFAQFEKLNLV